MLMPKWFMRFGFTAIDNPIEEKKNQEKMVQQHVDAAVLRVREMFTRENDNIVARSMKPHDPMCDNIECINNPCWKHEPDKIVSAPYEVKMKGSQ